MVFIIIKFEIFGLNFWDVKKVTLRWVWKRYMRHGVENKKSENIITLMEVRYSFSNANDTWTWLGNRNNCFSIKSKRGKLLHLHTLLNQMVSNGTRGYLLKAIVSFSDYF